MNRTKIEEVWNKNSYDVDTSFGKYRLMKEDDFQKALTSLLAEDGGEVGEANDEEILSDMTYRSGARRVEQIRWYRKGFLDHKKLLSNSAPSNEASQHTKGEGV